MGITGVAGPGGGSEEKPVGLVWLSVAAPADEPLTRSVNLPGGRADVRDRATTVAMHLVRRALLQLRGDRPRGRLSIAEAMPAGPQRGCSWRSIRRRRCASELAAWARERAGRLRAASRAVRPLRLLDARRCI